MRRLLAVFLALAVGVVVSGIYIPSDAATVGGAPISLHSLDTELTAVAQSPDYVCFLSEERALAGGSPVPVLGAGAAGSSTGVYDTTFVDDWLTSMLTDRVAAQLAARRVLAEAYAVLSRRITAVLGQYATDTGTNVPGCGGSGSAVLASMPGWFVHRQVVAEADQALLDARAAGAGLGKAGIAAYFASHGRTFARDCLSVIVLRTASAADAAEAAISRGAGFAQEASAVSLTTGTGARGGAAGCGLVVGTFLAPHLAKLPVHAVSSPFHARGVWWLVTVTSRTTVPLSSVRGIVLTAIVQAGQASVDAELSVALRRAHVTVDARYGTAEPRARALILPPVPPPRGALVSPSADRVPARAAAG
jgi:hypothetical protein